MEQARRIGMVFFYTFLLLLALITGAVYSEISVIQPLTSVKKMVGEPFSVDIPITTFSSSDAQSVFVDRIHSSSPYVTFVETLLPEQKIGVLSTEGCHDVHVDEPNQLAYVRDNPPSEILVIDISNKTNPTILHTVSFGSGYGYFSYKDDIMYLSDSNAHAIYIYNATNKTAIPEEIGSLTGTLTSAYDAAYQDGYCYISGAGTVRVLNCADRSSPSEVNTHSVGGGSFGMTIVGNYAYVAASTDGLKILDISNPMDIQDAGTYDTYMAHGVDVKKNGTLTVISDLEEGFKILDTTTKSSVSLIKAVDTARAHATFLDGNYLYVSDEAAGMIAYDVSDLENPEVLWSRDDGLTNGPIIPFRNYLYSPNSDNFAIYEFGAYRLEISSLGEPHCGANNITVEAVTADGTMSVNTSFLLEVGFDISNDWMFDGSKCYFMCSGEKLFNDSVQCSGHGSCANNTCQCESQWLGETCSVFTGFLYLGGGVSGDEEAVFECDTSSARISRRSGAGAFFFKNLEFFVFGGEQLRGTGSVYFNDVWKQDYRREEVVEEGMKRWCFVSGSETANFTQNLFNTSAEGELLKFSRGNHIGARSNFGSFSTEFSFFIFAGEKFRGNETNELWEFSVVGRGTRFMWRILHEHDDYTSLRPSPRSHLCVGGDTSSTSVFMFGGQGRDDRASQAEEMWNGLWKYDVLTNTFSLLKKGNGTSNTTSSVDFGSIPKNVFSSSLVPPHRAMHSCWVDKDDNFFIFGGNLFTQQVTNDVWVFNLTENNWGFIAGGGNNTMNEYSSSEKHSYDPENLPGTRFGSICFNRLGTFFSAENFHLFFGGQTKIQMFGDFWAFSNSLFEFKFVNGTIDGVNQATTLKEIGSRAFGVGAATRNKKLLILGGIGM